MKKLIKTLKWILIILIGLLLGFFIGLIISTMYGSTAYTTILFILFILGLIIFLSCILY